MKKYENVIKFVFGLIVIPPLIVVVYIFLRVFVFWLIPGLIVNDINDKKWSRIELENRENNRKILDEYLRKNYGEELCDSFDVYKIENVGKNSCFYIRTPFLTGFSVDVDTDNKKVYQDNFYEVLSTDEKFQHLYSDWVKKQIGCEDANVEFTFVGNFDKVQINFKNITKLSDNNIEIFENTKNFYSWLCKVRNIKNLGDDNKIIVAEKIRNEYLLKAMRVTGIPKDISKKYNGHIQLSNGKFDRVKDINYEFVFDVRDMKYEINERKY